MRLDGPATPNATQDIVTRELLDRGFRRLPTEKRAAFVLHHYLGWSLAEIADNLASPRRRSGRGSLARPN